MVSYKNFIKLLDQIQSPTYTEEDGYLKLDFHSRIVNFNEKKNDYSKMQDNDITGKYPDINNTEKRRKM